MVLLAFLLTLGIIIGALILICYIATSIGLTLLAKEMNLEFPWLAWVPLSKNYLMIKLGKKPKDMIFLYAAMWLAGFSFLGSTNSNSLMIVFFIIFLAFYIFVNIYTSLIYYKLAKEFNISDEAALTLTIIMPLRSILLFKMYNLKKKANNNFNYENMEI